MKSSLLCVVFTCIGSSPLVADGIRETNYLHIDPANSIVLHGFFSATDVEGRVIDGEGMRVGVALVEGLTGELVVSVSLQDRDSVAFLFDEEICAIGFQITLPSREQKNSIPVEMRFLARDGTVIDELRRQPALGTTSQAYSSEQFTYRFAGVATTTQTIGEMSIGEVRALPCSLAIS